MAEFGSPSRPTDSGRAALAGCAGNGNGDGGGTDTDIDASTNEPSPTDGETDEESMSHPNVEF